MADNFLDKAKDTFEDIINEVIRGGLMFVEGVRAGGTLANGGFLKGDIKDKITDQSVFDKIQALIDGKYNNWQNPFGLSNNQTIDKIYQDISNTKESYVNQLSPTGQQLVRGTAQGVGQLLPIAGMGSIATSLGLSAKTASALTMSTLFLSSGGQGTEQALNDGASLGEAAAYGALSGAVEVATEKLTGSLIPVFGKGVADDFVAKISTNKIFKNAVSALGEGAEEVISQLLQPVIEKVTYNKDAQFWSDQQKSDVIMSGLIGALSSLAYGGLTGSVVSSNQDIVDNIKTLENKSSNVFDRGRDNSGVESLIVKETNKLATKLSKMTSEDRALFIKENKLENYFNEDGTTIQRNNSQALSQAARQGNIPKNLKLAETVTEENVQTIKLANKLNKRVVFAELDKKYNGYYDPDTKTIVINSKKNVDNNMTVFVHELTHQLEGTKQYGDYVKFVIDQAETNETLQSYLKEQGITAEKIAELYAEGKNTDDYVILTEFIARATSEVLFKDANQVNKLVAENRTVAEKIYDWIKKQIKALKNPKTKAERAYLNMLNKATELYSNALENEQGGVKLSDINNRYSVEDLRKESIRKAMANELLSNESVFLGFTPSFLEKLGLKYKYLTITQNHLKNIIAKPKDTYNGKHAIPLSYVEDKMIKDLDDPMMAIKLEKNRVIIVSDSLDIDGFPIIMPMKLNTTSKVNEVKIEANHILSIYGRESFDNFLTNNKDNIIYANKEKTNAMFSRTGHTRPNFLNSLVYDTILQQVDEDVNTRYSKSLDSEGNQLSEAQNEFFKDSQIRDENGNLLVVYHGTDNFGFDSFKNLDNSNNTVIFMTDKRNIAESYTKEKSNVYELYADIKNPFIIDAKNTAWNLIKNPFTQNDYEVANNNTDQMVWEDGRPDEGWNTELFTTNQIVNNVIMLDQYDGIIIKNVVDFGKNNDKISISSKDKEKYISNVYISLKSSNQVKNTDNLSPTFNENIRLSVNLNNDQKNLIAKIDNLEFYTNKKGNYDIQIYNKFGSLEYNGNDLKIEEVQTKLGSEISNIIKEKSIDLKRQTINKRELESYIGIDTRKDYSNIVQEAKDRFGTTTNIEVAGYINVDGSMLDFGDGNNYRIMDHRDIANIMDLSGGDAMYKYIEIGNIRITPENGSLELSKKPNEKQISAIRKFINYFDGKINMDIWPSNETKFTDSSNTSYVKYATKTSPNRIINDILAYYENGIIPESNIRFGDDFRYSIEIDGETIDKNVTETDDLIAIHNLYENELLRTIQLGGFPVPSIAVTKPINPFEEFGNITVIFDKSVVDPKISGNRVFTRDVYTKTMPREYQELSNSVQDKLDKLQFNAKELDEMYRDYDFENTTKNGAIESLKYRAYVKYTYVKENNIPFEKIITRPKYHDVDVTEVQKFMDKHPEINRNMEYQEVMALKPEIGQMVIDSLPKVLLEKRLNLWNEFVENLGYAQLDSMIQSFVTAKMQGYPTEQYDSYKTRNELDKLVNYNDPAYLKWLNDYVDGMFNVEINYLDDRGKKIPGNLEALTKYMKSSKIVGDQSTIVYGLSNAIAESSVKLSSMSEIKQYASKLVDTATQRELKEALEKFDEDMRSIITKSRIDKGENFFNVFEEYYMAIADVLSGKSTVEQALVFHEFSKVHADKLQAVIDQIQEFPSDYYEAKPQRAVELNEIRNVLLPEETNKNLIDALEEKNIPYTIYKKEQSRSDIIQSMEDIRFSKELDAKEKAKYTREKVYNKKDAETVINGILDEVMVFKDFDGKITSKTKDQVIRMLWKELNTAHPEYRGRVALEIANYIIEHGFAEEAFQTNLTDYEFLDAVEYFKQKIDFDSMKNDLNNAFGNDKSIYGVFGKRRGVKSTTAENMIAELESKGINLDGNTIQDQIIDMYNKYKQAKVNIKKQIKNLKSVLSKDELTELKNGIVRNVLNAFDENGKLTPYHNQLLKIQDLKSQLKDARVYSSALSNMMNSVDRVAGLEKYASVESIPLSQEIVGLVKLLKKIKSWRGNLASADNIRTIMSKYASKVENAEGKLVPLYDLYNGIGITDRNDFGEMVEQIVAGKGALTVDELRQIDLILTNFVHNVKNFDKVFFEGKVQERSIVAREIDAEMRRVTPLSEKGMSELLGNYVRWVQSPIWRFDRLSNYHKEGFFPRFYNELMNAVSKQVEFKRDVSNLYEDFFKKHKDVAKRWRDQTYDFDGIKLSKGQMISLYMLSFREQAQTHLFNVEENRGVVRISDEKAAKNFKYKEAISGGKDFEITPTMISQIESKLTSVDMEYITLTKKFFNQLSKNAKSETDVALYGVTNVVDGEYFPIRVSDDVLYKQIGDNGFGFNNMFSVYSASFNKDVKRNAKNKVVIENVLDVVERHAQQMSSYYGLAIPIKSFNQIWNTQVDPNTKVSSVVSKIDKTFERYVSDLFKAMQGIHAQKTSFDRVMGKIRGNWAKAALGLNPKVVATQFASVLASHGGGIEYKSLIKGIMKSTSGKTDYETLYKHSPLMWDRASEGFNVDLGLLKEQKGLLGNVDKLTELSTSLIGKTDNFVIGIIWNAALDQTKGKYKLNSKEHFDAAAKLVESVTFRTQANWTAIARPSILQTDNALLQTFTMFMSEPLQIFSQIAGNIDRVRIARKELANAKNAAERKQAEQQIKVASQQARQYSVAMVSGAVYLSIVGMLFKWIKFGIDDEEDAKQTAYQEAIGYFIGTMPFIRDIYSLSQGYELSNMYETGLNNMWNGGKAVYNMLSGIFEADYTTSGFIKDSRTLLLGISQTLGIPLKNLETYIKGILEKVDESITYRYNDNFYTQSYSSDLQAAIEDGNDKLSDTIIDLMMKDKNIGLSNDAVKSEMTRLTKLGYSVMPKAMLTSINVDGSSVKLTNSQYKAFQSTYSQSETKVANIVNMSAYKQLSDDAKAKSVKLIYDYYYNTAKEDLTGEDYNGNLGYAAKAVNIEKLALIIGYSKTTSGSTKKSLITTFMIRQGLTLKQRNVVLAYLGYSVDDTTSSYLKSLGLTNDEIDAFLA
ncbi:MAG: DUF6782 family putative metallopeptidase [Acholeplasmataceae bacterium]